MKKNGFVLSTYIYMLLVFFLLLLVVMLSVLSNTKVLSKKLKENATEKSALKSSSFSLVLLGDKDFVVAENDEFIDPGVIAKTKAGKDLTNSVLITSNVDTSVEGEYQVTYRLSYNGLTKEVVRNVIVGKTTIIVLDANGGTSELDYKTIVKGSLYGELPIPTYAGKTFLGWYTSLSDGELVLSDTNVPEMDTITLYAHWVNSIYTYDYTGDVQVFTAPIDGYYRLNVWGAQGGTYSETNYGGYGGYSTGIVRLDEGEELYVYVGGAGNTTPNANDLVTGGYNGGGSARREGGTGGGATHISTTTGLLSSFTAGDSNILIVAGGGGGAGKYSTAEMGGAGGGITGNDGGDLSTSYQGGGHGGTQTSGGVLGSSGNGTAGDFALGGSGGYYTSSPYEGSGGGGGGYYGGAGGVGRNGGGGGGSGYIGNVLLYSKAMYCYNCTESGEVNTKTTSTTCVSDSAEENCAKQGNGYAIIEYVETTEEDMLRETPFGFGYTGASQKFDVPISGYYKLEIWGGQGGDGSGKIGGYGGYSTGITYLTPDDDIYIVVGAKGSSGTYPLGGYNGGGQGRSSGTAGGGGGATHISKVDGELSALSSYAQNNESPILMVAGGGGGALNNASNGGGGGGFNGVSVSGSTGGTQTTPGTNGSYSSGSTFGVGSHYTSSSSAAAGGGAGYYGGGSAHDKAGSGGSGYIGNVGLSNKVMYCYNCTESSDVSTKTVSTTCVSATATANCSKQGNGYAKITYIGD